jgi:acyl-coenzyme A thioesterase PaaI-like protein
VARAAGLSEEKVKAMFAQVGTIDLRVDYLRPGRGERFTARGESCAPAARWPWCAWKCMPTRKLLVAVGTGTYMIG